MRYRCARNRCGRKQFLVPLPRAAGEGQWQIYEEHPAHRAERRPFSRRGAEELNIGGCQAKYLLAVAREPGISQEELARSLFVNKSNVARQIEALERAGLVRREENERDRRAVLVYPTGKLQEALPRIREVFAAWRALVTEGFTAEERETLARLTGKLVENGPSLPPLARA